MPIGDGYEIEVNEFDDNGICYDWRRSHAKDGCSAYRPDWNGLQIAKLK